MRVLHVIGIDNGWAIANRARAIARAMPDIQSRTMPFNDVAGSELRATDFVHVHGLQIIPHIKARLPGCGVPWGFEVISERSMKHARQLGGLTKFANCCFAKNPRLAEAIRPFVSCEPVYIPNGVDCELFHPAFRVGWVGNKRDENHLKYKGVPLIIEAIGLLNAEQRGFSFEWAPDPSDYPRVLPQAELVPYYRSIDVLVCASFAEGCSNVVNEALACGVPVVSTDVGTARELNAEWLPVTIVERSAKAIAEGIVHALDTRIGNVANMRSYAWDSDRIAGAYRKSYAAAIKEGARQ